MNKEQRIEKARRILRKEVNNNLFERKYKANELLNSIYRFNIKGEDAQELCVYALFYQYYMLECAKFGCNFTKEPSSTNEMIKRLYMLKKEESSY